MHSEPDNTTICFIDLFCVTLLDVFCLVCSLFVFACFFTWQTGGGGNGCIRPLNRRRNVVYELGVAPQATDFGGNIEHSTRIWIACMVFSILIADYSLFSSVAAAAGVILRYST